jgi:hypothetical protein
LLDSGASLGFLPLHQAHHAYNFESKFPRSFNGLDRGGSRGADVINDDHPRSFFPKALDALTRAMLFLGFANKKCVDIAAYHGDRYGQRIRTHRQPADRFRIPAPRANLLQKYLPSQLGTASIECRGPAIDVVVAASSGGELELAQTKRLRCEQSQQFFSRRKHELLRYQQKQSPRSGRPGLNACPGPLGCRLVPHSCRQPKHDWNGKENRREEERAYQIILEERQTQRV